MNSEYRCSSATALQLERRPASCQWDVMDVQNTAYYWEYFRSEPLALILFDGFFPACLWRVVEVTRVVGTLPPSSPFLFLFLLCMIFSSKYSFWTSNGFALALLIDT
jgi:hypothetical protein